jgi:hypothetical protein
MKRYARSVSQLILLALAFSAASFAAEDGSLYLVHGIPGRDVAANANPGLPVDVFINDEVCYAKGAIFGSSVGPLSLPAGDYDVKISPANSLAPCTNAPLIEGTVKLGAGAAVTAVAALNGSGAPALLTFPDSLTAVTAGEARLTMANAADASALTVKLAENFGTHPKTRTFTLNAGQRLTVNVASGAYSLVVTANGSSTPLVTTTVFATNQGVDLLYFVGSAANSSVSLIQRAIQDVF